MKIFGFCLVAIAAGAPSFAQTIPPATPSLTAGAEIKGLRFDWEPVAGASWYELEYKPNQVAPFVQHSVYLDASITTTKFRLPLHLFNWTYARYRLAACNSAGCTRSPEISVSSLRRFPVGYFKPAQKVVGTRLSAGNDLAGRGLELVADAIDDSLASRGGV